MEVKILFYFSRRLGNLSVNNTIQLQSPFQLKCIVHPLSPSASHPNKSGNQAWGVGSSSKHKLRTGDQKDKQKQKAAKGRHKESQLSVRRLQVMEERKQLLEKAKEQWGEHSTFLAFISV